jgi:hypothetical protein
MRYFTGFVISIMDHREPLLDRPTSKRKKGYVVGVAGVLAGVLLTVVMVGWKNNVFSEQSILKDTLASASGRIEIVYKTPWKPAYIHYNLNGAGWTTPPGKQMEASEIAGFDPSEYQFFLIPQGSTVEFVLNNGQGSWDHPSRGGNYLIDSPGRWKVENGALSFIQDLPNGMFLSDSFLKN